jgi:hypothetical protein
VRSFHLSLKTRGLQDPIRTSKPFWGSNRFSKLRYDPLCRGKTTIFHSLGVFGVLLAPVLPVEVLQVRRLSPCPLGFDSRIFFSFTGNCNIPTSFVKKYYLPYLYYLPYVPKGWPNRVFNTFCYLPGLQPIFSYLPYVRYWGF